MKTETEGRKMKNRKKGFTLIELLVNTSQHNCFSLLLKSPQLP